MSFTPTWRFQLPNQSAEGDSRADYALTIERIIGLTPSYRIYRGDKLEMTIKGNIWGLDFLVHMDSAPLPVAQCGRGLFQWDVSAYMSDIYYFRFCFCLFLFVCGLLILFCPFLVSIWICMCVFEK